MQYECYENYLKQYLPDGKPAYWGGIPGGGNSGRFKCGGNDILHAIQTWQKNDYQLNVLLMYY